MLDTFSYYWLSVQRALPRLLLFSVAVTFVVWLVVSSVGPTHQVHFSYLVSLSEREAASEFRFDGFYALSATDLFSATLAQWTTTPEVVVAAYDRAGLALPSHDPRVLTRAISATKSAPQLVEVTVKHKDSAAAEQLAQGLRQVMERNIEQYHDQGIPAARFRVVATQPWLGTTTLSVPIITLATFLFVFLLAVNGVLLIESIKRV